MKKLFLVAVLCCLSLSFGQAMVSSLDENGEKVFPLLRSETIIENIQQYYLNKNSRLELLNSLPKVFMQLKNQVEYLKTGASKVKNNTISYKWHEVSPKRAKNRKSTLLGELKTVYTMYRAKINEIYYLKATASILLSHYLNTLDKAYSNVFENSIAEYRTIESIEQAYMRLENYMSQTYELSDLYNDSSKEDVEWPDTLILKKNEAEYLLEALKTFDQIDSTLREIDEINVLSNAMLQLSVAQLQGLEKD